MSLGLADTLLERRMPDKYTDCHVSRCMSEGETDQVQSNIDYCCRVTCNIPVSFTEAVNSDKSREWVKAMDEEMHSLKGTTHLP